jgi:integrase
MSTQQANCRPSSKSHLLSQEQLQRILVLLTEDPTLRSLHDVVVFMSNTGIRAGKLPELRWADVDGTEDSLVAS